MRRRLLVPIAILASVFVILLALAPPGRVRLTLAPDTRVVRGAIHVHTTVSDGAGTPDAVAAAATSSGVPAPSESVVWTWMAPRTTRASGASVSRTRPGGASARRMTNTDARIAIGTSRRLRMR